MAVTRLERKGRKNKAVAKKRTATIKLHLQKPVIKNVDIEVIKAEFEAAKKKPEKKEEPKKEVVAKSTEKPAKVAPAEATAEKPANVAAKKSEDVKAEKPKAKKSSKKKAE